MSVPPSLFTSGADCGRPSLVDACFDPSPSVFRAFDENYDNLAVESRDVEFRARAMPVWEALKAECGRIKVRQPGIAAREDKESSLCPLVHGTAGGADAVE